MMCERELCCSAGAQVFLMDAFIEFSVRSAIASSAADHVGNHTKPLSTPKSPRRQFIGDRDGEKTWCLAKLEREGWKKHNLVTVAALHMVSSISSCWPLVPELRMVVCMSPARQVSGSLPSVYLAARPRDLLMPCRRS